MKLRSEVIREWACEQLEVSFPIFEQATVAGEDADPLFKWLEKARGQPLTDNAGKFLLDEEGEFLCFWPKEIGPMDSGVRRDLDKLLA